MKGAYFILVIILIIELIIGLIINFLLYSQLTKNVSDQLEFLTKYCSPHAIFLRFLKSVNFDHSILLDFLISNETIFLEFFLTYSKYLENNITEFHLQCKEFDNISNTNEINNCYDRVGELFVNLGKVIQNLMNNDLFPYNVIPLLNRIKAIEKILIH